MRRFSLLVPLLLASPALAQVEITSVGTPYTQNFNFLPAGPVETLAWTDNVTLPGWHLYYRGDPDDTVEPIPPGTPAGVRTNSLSEGVASGIYFYWTRADADATNYSLTTVANDSSGSLLAGLQLRNATGTTLSGIRVSYTGKQWRASNEARVAALAPEWRLGDGATIDAGSWTRVEAGVFYTPDTGAFNVDLTEGRDGNSPAMSTPIGPFEISGLNWAPGTDLWIRFFDQNDSGVDHAVGLDDLTIVAVAEPTPNLVPNAVAITRPGETYGQNFDVSLGPLRVQTWTDGTYFPGWYAWIGGGTNSTPLPAGPTPVVRITNQASASSTGYFFLTRSGITQTDHAFGAVPADAAGELRFGVKFVNETGSTLTSFRVGYTGEQWRHSNSTNVNQLDVEWHLGPLANLSESAGNLFSELTFVSLHNPGGASTNLDGNAPENRLVLGPETVSGITWEPGQELWIIFVKENAGSIDHGLLVDNFFFQALRGDEPPLSPTLPKIATRQRGNGLRLAWEGIAGLEYRVESSLYPNPASFTPFTTVTPLGDGPADTLVPFAGDNAFYRIVTDLVSLPAF